MTIADVAVGSAISLDRAGSEPVVDATPARRLTFTGDGRTYFGIWIVNILLSIVTLGIYSAWGKVRTRRYFYGNTSLDGAAFDYHANPVALLKGRLVAVAVIGLITVFNQFSPILYGVAMLALMFALPWIANRSLQFNARMTSWRNVRFDFHSTYWTAFNALLVMPVLTVFSLGLLAPVATRIRQNYILNGLRLGTTPFETKIYDRELYRGLGYAVLTFAAGSVILFALFWAAYPIVEWAAQAITNSGALTDPDGNKAPVGAAVFLIGFYVGILNVMIAAVVYGTMAYNVALNSTTLVGAGRLWSQLSPARMLWITVSNTLAIIATVGFFYPWAKARAWRYRSELTGIVPEGNLDTFVDSKDAAGQAYGSEYADLANVDIGF